MKIKLFIASILVLLALVGYQKYSEYSALRSIDSYESCAAAKGSLIQESYPATCITRLGTRFTEPTPQASPIKITVKPTPNNWATYQNNSYGFIFKYPSEWKIMEESAPPDNLPLPYIDTGIDSKTYSPEISNYKIYVYKHSNFPTLYTPITKIINNTSFIEDYNIEKYPLLTYYIPIPNDEGYLQFLFGPYEKTNISKNQIYYQNIYYQILSTFKFTN